MKLNKFTFGISLGVIIGLLVAPEKGSTTRKKLATTACDLKNKIDDWMGKDLSDLEELKLAVADESAELSQEMRLKLLKVIDKAKKSYDDLKKELS